MVNGFSSYAIFVTFQKYDADKMKYMMETAMLRKRQEKMEKKLVILYFLTRIIYFVTNSKFGTLGLSPIINNYRYSFLPMTTL